MKINPIKIAYNKHYFTTTPITDKKQTKPEPDSILTPLPDNYGRMMVFKGITDKTRELVRNASFEDKLAIGLKELNKTSGVGNYLLAATNMKEIAQMMNYIELPVPIKKLVILTDPKFTDKLLLARNGKTNTLINIEKKPIATTNYELLNFGDSTKIQNGECLKITQGWFEIKEEPQSEIVKEHANMFMQVLDYTQDIQKQALEHNKKVTQFIEEIDKPAPKNRITFDSVGGQDEAIEALKKNILFPLKYPDIFEGFMISRGAILYGPPGTGKTLIAKALAAESDASVFEISATEFADKYVGESEKNCRELFQKAINAQPSIIYIDEIDALGTKRGEDIYGDKLLAQFLASMSELEKQGDKVFIIGSTNRKESLDAAFTRSGRFSTLLEVKAPDLKGIKQILQIHTNNKPIDKNFDIDDISKRMYAKKMTGADIAAIVKEAFSIALDRTGIYKSMDEGRFSPSMKDYLVITNEDFIKAISEFKGNSPNRNPIGYNK